VQKEADARLSKSEHGGVRLPTPVLSPPRPKLLSILPHDRSRRFEPYAAATTLVDIYALGCNAPHDILGGQYRCHRSPP